MTKKELGIKIIGIFCFVSGIAILATLSWKAVVGVFLFAIGNNIEQHFELKKILIRLIESLENK